MVTVLSAVGSVTARVVSKSSAVAPSNTTLAPKDSPWISLRNVLNRWRNVSNESVVVVMDASDGSGTDEAGAILLDASGSGVDEGEALLYEEGTGDHIVNPVLQIGGNFVFEGATDNEFETTLSITDPTADRTVTIQDKTGTVALQGRDIDDIIVLNGTDASGTDESSAIILDGDATSVVGVVVNVGEALLYEEGVNDHILNPTFEGVEEFIILEESLEGTPSFALKENVDSSSLDARFAYQPATSDNLLFRNGVSVNYID